MLVEIDAWRLFGIITFLFLLRPITITLWRTVRIVLNFTPTDLRDKYGDWAVITGSTDGIGKAYAKELAAKGFNLILISRNLERLKNTRSAIADAHSDIEIRIIEADFGRGEAIFDDIRNGLKDVEVGILVNNVGMNYIYPTSFGEVTEEHLWKMINVNVGATTLMTRAVINEMKKRGKGAIVNVSSMTETHPIPTMAIYAATKCYIRSFSQALQYEYSKYGITIQNLAPGLVQTKMIDISKKLPLLVVDTTTFARSALSTLGKADYSHGHWIHELTRFWVSILPCWALVKVWYFLLVIMKNDNYKRKL